MIAPPIPSRALDGPHIARLFDHAQERRIAPRVATDRAGIVVRQVAAGPAGYDLAPNPPDGLPQPLRGFRGLLQQMEREPLSGLPPDAGELGELRHELLDGDRKSTRLNSSHC